MPKSTQHTKKLRAVDLVDTMNEVRARLGWVVEALLAHEEERDSESAAEEYGAIIIREQVEHTIAMLEGAARKYDEQVESNGGVE